jgi:hypothetical protein
MTSERWPALPYDAWKDTYETLHMWSQIVGKIALARAVPINHSWSVAFDVTARGLTTRTLPYGDRSFRVAFDFIDHQLVIETSDSNRRALPLAPRTVAEFYREVMATLRDMALPVTIWPMPVEVPNPIRFDEDTVHRSYDASFANRFWRILLKIHETLTASSCDFVGKCSPVHFFWGSFDLVVTRFSGRLAPPREGPAFMRDAYSHEVISHGFWPGNAQLQEPVFYAYSVPEPEGFKDASVQPDGAYYHPQLGEFILPYDAARSAASAERAIIEFVDSTYATAATLAKWDRAALETNPHARRRHG